jgi:hypothetical protein
MSQPVVDLAGQRFGQLIVLERGRSNAKKARDAAWRCRCDCGAEKTVLGKNLRGGLTRSCGHLVSERMRARATHGESRPLTPEYRTWGAMITRCENPHKTGFKNFGGRGVKVCDEWRNDFATFLAYVGRKPSPKHSLDRWPDNDGDYRPGNVRWATTKEQRANQRRRACKS